MMSNYNILGLQKHEPVIGNLMGIKRIRGKCYFTVTSVFVQRGSKQIFTGYIQGCLRPYFLTGYIPTYGDLEEVGRRQYREKLHI